MELLKPKTKISLTETLTTMPIGKEMVIKASDWSADEVRKKVFWLKKNGYQFKVTKIREIDDTYITRLV